MPNDQWDDFALTQKFNEVDRRLDNHDDGFKGLSHFPTDVATAALNIEHLTTELSEFRDELRHTREERGRGRVAITVAVITGCATVVAAIIVLLAQVWGAG
jgi:hypothetical protein